jgi:hypothetical protein
MVPKKSNIPIKASVEAAATAPTSKSAHNAMKWVWMSPLVLRPQTKNVAARIQNAPLPEISLSTVSAPPTAGAGGGALPPLSP